MFRGHKALNLDAKGRLTMPAKFRDQLIEKCNGNLILNPDRCKCINIYPLPRWEEIEEALGELSTTKDSISRFTQYMASHSEECEMDSQGRFVVPANLRQYAGLGKQVVVAGNFKKLQLWNDGAFAAHNGSFEWFSGDNVPEELASLAL